MVKNETEAEGSSRPKSIGVLTVLRCISGPNLVILAWTGAKLSCGQAQIRINLDFMLEIKVNQPPKQQRS